MTDHLTEDDILAAIPGLTRARLVTYIEAEMIVPLRNDLLGGRPRRFRQVDCARLHLLCDLADGLDLPPEALGVILSLIDQLHTTRADLFALTRAVGDEAPEVRARIAMALRADRG